MEAAPPTYPVLVGNVSGAATEATLRKFFSFCGAIHLVELSSEGRANEPDVQQAIVHFKSVAAQETALLLGEALIEERPISICRFAVAVDVVGLSADDGTWGAAPSSSTEAGEPADAAASPAAAEATDGEPTSEQYASLQGLMGAGYRLGQQALDFLSDRGAARHQEAHRRDLVRGGHHDSHQGARGRRLAAGVDEAQGL